MTVQIPSSNTEQLLQEAINSILVDVHTALPGIIESFDTSTQQAKVNLALKRFIRQKDGTEISNPIPPVLDLPVVIPQVQNFAITLPVQPGDECLVIFSERDIDNWVAQGRTVEPRSRRRFDYSDGYVIPTGSSASKAITSYSGENLVIRTIDNTASITITPSGDITIMNASTVTVLTDQLNVTATSQASITAPMIDLTGTVTINGLTTVNGSAVVTGTMTAAEFTAGGVDFTSHVHGGVTTGAGTTGGPQ